MYDYHFELAGLHAVLRTQETLRVADRLRPFFMDAESPVDCAITVESWETLPDMPPAAVKNGQEYYHRQGDVLRIFHCDGEKHFAVTELEGGNVRIFVLSGYEDRFSGTTGILNRIGMENLLLGWDGILLHAAFIQYKNKGILFTGPSGIGKSTQAALWEQHLGAEIINGDRAVLRKAGIWTAYGSPYAGSSGIYRRENAPVCAIVALHQGKENKLEKLSGKEALAEIYPQLAACPFDKGFMEKVTDLALALLNDVPVYRLSCLPDQSATICLQKGLGL